MSEKYEMRQGADSLWEVLEAATGEVVRLGGMLLSGLDEEAAKGALSVLLNDVVQPNGTSRSPPDSVDKPDTTA